MIKGDKGEPGENGVGIADVVQNGELMTVILSDGRSYDVQLPQGPAGKDGVNGKTPVIDPKGLAKQIQPHLQPIRVYWVDAKTKERMTAPVDVRLGETLPLETLEK